MPKGIFVRTKEHIENQRVTQIGRPKYTNEKHSHLWKGAKAGYKAMHLWVIKWKGRPQECEMCGTTQATKYEWANVDHTYKRILEDYIRMCSPCHGKYDSSRGFRKRKGVYLTVEEFNKLVEPTSNINQNA